MEKRIVEINGAKIEVDMRTAKTVESYKVGDQVKILVKDYGTYTSYPGVIVGFDEFKALPTILVAYIKSDYSGADLKIAHINAKNEDVEICPANENDLSIEKGSMIEAFDRKISAKELEMRDLFQKKHYFINMFGKYFEQPQN